MAVALSLATGSVAAQTKGDLRKPGAAQAQGRAKPPAGSPRAAAKPVRVQGEAKRKGSDAQPAARSAVSKSERRPAAKGAPPEGVKVATARHPAGPPSRAASAQGTVIIGGICAKITVGSEKYPCKGAIYALHPDGRVSVQFATHQSTVMLVGGSERETEALEFAVMVDQVRIATDDRPTRQFGARGRCTVAMKDASGEYVRTISCSAKGGAAELDVEFRSNGEKVDAYDLLTGDGPPRGRPRA